MDKFLQPPILDIDPKSPTATKEWKHWKRKFTIFAKKLEKCNNDDKLMLLLAFISPDISEFIDECTEFDDAIGILHTIYDNEVTLPPTLQSHQERDPSKLQSSSNSVSSSLLQKAYAPVIDVPSPSDIHVGLPRLSINKNLTVDNVIITNATSCEQQRFSIAGKGTSSNSDSDSDSCTKFDDALKILNDVVTDETLLPTLQSHEEKNSSDLQCSYNPECSTLGQNVHVPVDNVPSSSNTLETAPALFINKNTKKIDDGLSTNIASNVEQSVDSVDESTSSNSTNDSESYTQVHEARAINIPPKNSRRKRKKRKAKDSVNGSFNSVSSSLPHNSYDPVNEFSNSPNTYAIATSSVNKYPKDELNVMNSNIAFNDGQCVGSTDESTSQNYDSESSTQVHEALTDDIQLKPKKSERRRKRKKAKDCVNGSSNSVSPSLLHSSDDLAKDVVNASNTHAIATTSVFNKNHNDVDNDTDTNNTFIDEVQNAQTDISPKPKKKKRKRKKKKAEDSVNSSNDIHRESTPISGSISEANANKRSFNTDIKKQFLDKLGLTEYFPEKITLQIAMEKSSDRLESLMDLPWYLITKIMMLDYRGREDIASLSSNMTNTEKEIGPEALACDIVTMFEKHSYVEDSPISNPYPLDVVVALFVCCSNLFRQVLCEKMFMCKLSIPFLLPSYIDTNPTVLYWALRTISLEFQKPNEESIEASAVDYPYSVISCLRIGKTSRSKSKFLNELLNEQSHSTFYHRDCAGGLNERILSDGLIEISWKLRSKTSGDKKDEKNAVNIFRDSNLAILNLRGDAQANKMCKTFIGQISDAILVMVEINQLYNENVVDELSSLVSTNSKLVLMISKNPAESINPEYKESVMKCVDNLTSKGFKTCCVILDDGTKNLKDLKNETEQKISRLLVSEQGKGSLEDRKKFIDLLEIKVDENNKDCNSGKCQAQHLMRIVEEVGKENTGTSKLPLQCEPWQSWSKLFKEERRREKMDGMDISKYINDIHEKKKVERKKQIQLIQGSKLFNIFLNHLNEFKGEDRLYYLQWLKLYLDSSSKKIIPELRKKVSLKWNEIQAEQNQDNLSSLQKEIKEIEEELAESSFGLEHFIRECSQAFEAYRGMEDELSKDIGEKIQALPNIMAELMHLGYPIELMDGDAASVPLTWVEAVLGQLQENVGHDKKIFVLSVLGIQSSGKSTLLNTMFGLQFSVAAGRCTRGVYAQLIQIPNEHSKCPFDYVLVVDTEGLRAAELEREKVQHDNEIATLVVGLGDVTLVNIKGENMAEMEDVLQIVIHALLKMRLVNKSLELQPKCFFIHQNVPALDAAQKLRSGQQKFIETLDKVTRVAGKKEDRPHYTKFSQVIDFDINTSIKYFSDLYKGDPPMAPANPGYSENVNQVKQILLNGTLDKRSGYLTIQKLLIKLNDLWKGVLDQDFVFSFKNSLELEAFGNLEDTLSNLLWKLKEASLKWQNLKMNEIMSTESGIERLQCKFEQDCYDYHGDIYESLKRNLKDIFEKSEDTAMVGQWKTRTFLKLDHCYADVTKRVLCTINSVSESRKIQIEQERNSERYKNEIVTKAIEVAVMLRSSPNQDLSSKEMESHFQNIWCEKMKILPTNFEKEINIHSHINSVLHETFSSDIPLLRMALDHLYIEDADTIRKSFKYIFQNHVSQPKLLYRFAARVTNTSVSNDYFIDILFAKVASLIEHMKDSQLQSENFVQVKNVVKELIADIRCKRFNINQDSKFKRTITILTCKYASNIYYYKFYQMQVNFVNFNEWKFGIHPFYQDMLEETYSEHFESTLNQHHSKELGIPQISLPEIFINGKTLSENNLQNYVTEIFRKLEKNVKAYVTRSEIQEFKREYVEEIIKLIEDNIKESNYGITKQFRIDLVVKLCYKVLSKFEEKHTLYVEDLDPKIFLKKKYYNIYLQVFINTYKGVNGEEALTTALSEHLSTAIENAVELNLPSELADNVRCEVPEVKTKSALIKAILRKLLEIDQFEEYMLYLEDIDTCFEKWISYFVDKHLFSLKDKERSSYMEIISRNILRLTSNVCQDISKSAKNLPDESNLQTSLHSWVEIIQKSLAGKVIIVKQDLLNIIKGYDIFSMKTFNSKLEENLHKLEDQSIRKFRERSAWKTNQDKADGVYDLIYLECKGCTKKCPFCYAPCSYNTVDHEKGEGNIKHMAKEHHPGACGTWIHLHTKKMVTKSCPELIGSEATFRCHRTNWERQPYKDYQKYYPDWKIDGDISIEASPYWKWFLVKYNDQLADRIYAKPADIPTSWRDITKEMAEKSIDKI